MDNAERIMPWGYVVPDDGADAGTLCMDASNSKERLRERGERDYQQGIWPQRKRRQRKKEQIRLCSALDVVRELSHAELCHEMTSCVRVGLANHRPKTTRQMSLLAMMTSLLRLITPRLDPFQKLN